MTYIQAKIRCCQPHLWNKESGTSECDEQFIMKEQ